MEAVRKRVDRRISELDRSGRTLSDVFDIFFEDEELTFAEMSSATRRLSFSYGAVKKDVLTLAAAICKTGTRGSWIGLYGGNSLRWIVSFWAILKSGNMPYLINLRQPKEFGNSILSDLGAAFVLDCDGKGEFSLPTRQYGELFDLGKNGEEISLPPCADRFALSTNGTTLKKKICFYTGKQISAQLLNVTEMFKEAPDLARPYKGKIKVLAFLPLYHVFGLEAMYLWYCLFGATFVFLTDMNPDTIFRTVRKHRVTHIFAVPLLWHGLEKGIRKTLASKDEKTQNKFRKASALTLKLWNISPALGRFASQKFFGEIRSKLFGDSVVFMISGGSFLKPSALELINSVGYPLYNGYGMTEIGITSVELSPRAKDRLLGSIGRAFPSVEYSVGENDRLLVRGSSLCESMLVDGEPVSTDGWFDTGDVVRITPDGRTYINGRISDIVFGDEGENLNPDFAEGAFSLSSAVQLCVTGTEDNSRLMLVVQLRPDITPEEKDRLSAEIDAANETLPPNYRVGKVFYTFDPIAEEGAIKVSRAALKARMAQGKVRPCGDIAPKEEIWEETVDTSGIKAELRAIFADILGLNEKEITDNGHFMNDLGGSSLDYFTLIGEINTQFGITLDFESEEFGYSLNDFENILKKRLG